MNWAGDLPLHRGVVMTEATAVRGGQEYIVHLMWGEDDVPKEKGTHIGTDLPEWVNALGMNIGEGVSGRVWEPAAKRILISAKLFPGLSRKVVESQGREWVDELDKELYEQMPADLGVPAGTHAACAGGVG